MSPSTVHDMYEQGRARISELAREAAGGEPVATCPQWTVKDVLAHVTGVCADVLAGNIEGAATDPWTAAQVEQRRERTVDELLAEWEEVGPPVAQMADQFGPAGHQLLFDLTTHEHDLRAALGRPGARDVEAVADGLRFVTTGLVAGAIDGRGLAPLELVTEAGTFTVGSGDPAPVRVEASAFELLRALSGRRSEAQIRAYAWSDDPSPYLPAFVGGPFTMPADDIVE
jgi:uncharacterized protein (TIGR03083 family)